MGERSTLFSVLLAAMISFGGAAQARPRRSRGVHPTLVLPAQRKAPYGLTLTPVTPDGVSLSKSSLHDRLVLVSPPPEPEPKNNRESATKVMFLFATTLHADGALRALFDGPVHPAAIFSGGGIGGAVGGRLP